MRRRTWMLATLVALGLAVAGCGGIRDVGGAERPVPTPTSTTVGSGGEASTDDAPSISIGGATETEPALQEPTTTTATTETTTETTETTATAPPPPSTGGGATFDPGELDLDTSDIDHLLAELDGLLGELEAGFAQTE